MLWNFEKFLIAKDGTVVRRFAPVDDTRRPVDRRRHRRGAGALTLAGVRRSRAAAGERLS